MVVQSSDANTFEWVGTAMEEQKGSCEVTPVQTVVPCGKAPIMFSPAR